MRGKVANKMLEAKPLMIIISRDIEEQILNKELRTAIKNNSNKGLLINIITII